MVCFQVNETDKKQKLPINENTNFCIILNQHNPSRERDAHFLISVKKSKKDRKGTHGMIGHRFIVGAEPHFADFQF